MPCVLFMAKNNERNFFENFEFKKNQKERGDACGMGSRSVPFEKSISRSRPVPFREREGKIGSVPMRSVPLPI